MGIQVIEKTCVICAKIFTVPPARMDTAKTCGRVCSGKLAAKTYAAGRVEKTCRECGGKFLVPPSHADRRIFCSDWCADPHRHYNPPKREKHYRWNGGKSNHPDGYLYISVPWHPFGDRTGNYVLEHRVVMELWMQEVQPDHPFLFVVEGRVCLRPEILVHHINENKRDNRRTNLLACTVYAHRDIHDGRAPMVGEVWPNVEGSIAFEARKVLRKCMVCEAEFIKSLRVVRAGGGKYCSRACYNARPRQTFTVQLSNE